MTIDGFIDSLRNDPQSLIERFNSYSQRRGFKGQHHPPEIIEAIRKASIGRPKTAEELAKLRAAALGEKNGFYSKHHTDTSKRKGVETKIRNGTLGRFPQKSLTLLQIAKELDDAGVDKVKIASLALKQMRENGMKMSRVHAYRVLPQQYKNPSRVAGSRNGRIRVWEAKRTDLELQIKPLQCIECGSNISSQWYRPEGQYQCSKCYHKQYSLTYCKRPDVIASKISGKREWRARRKALGLPYQ